MSAANKFLDTTGIMALAAMPAWASMPSVHQFATPPSLPKGWTDISSGTAQGNAQTLVALVSGDNSAGTSMYVRVDDRVVLLSVNTTMHRAQAVVAKPVPKHLEVLEEYKAKIPVGDYEIFRSIMGAFTTPDGVSVAEDIDDTYR
ncbi:MAG: hypothetical protein ACKVT0_23840 [Planctomycetaceae bacterium]